MAKIHLRRRDNTPVAISKAEVDGINRAIANQICGSPAELTLEEREFLADATARTFADVAAFLGVHKSTVSKWRSQGAVPRGATGALLKRWFWFLLFGESSARWTASVSHFRTDNEFLAYVHDRAIQARLADAIGQLKAS